MTEITDVAKLFLEKHLIATLIAGTAALITVLLIPSDNWMLSKLGKQQFLLLVAGVVFLTIYLMIYIYNLVKRKGSKDYKKAAEHTPIVQETNKKAIYVTNSVNIVIIHEHSRK